MKTSDQIRLFDLGGGDKAKEEGIARATENTKEWYRLQFVSKVRAIPQGVRFTSETITLAIGLPPGHPSQVGSLMNGIAKMGLIRMTGVREKARRTNQHSAKLEVWIRV